MSYNIYRYYIFMFISWATLNGLHGKHANPYSLLQLQG